MTVRWKRKKNKRLPSPTAPPAEKPTTVLAQLSRKKTKPPLLGLLLVNM